MQKLSLWLSDISNKISSFNERAIISVIITTCAEILNRWDWCNYMFIYLKISRIIDWIWYISLIFAYIVFTNWIIRKLWNYLNSINYS